jgi:hypothetical protein
MDNLTLQLAAACALALGFGAYKLATSRRRPLNRSLAGWFRLAPPRKLLAPSQIRFEGVILDDTDADLQYVIPRSASLRRLGFQIVGDFTHRALPGFYHRAFVHPEHGFYALLIHAPGKDPFIELHSFFADGSTLTTTDADERDHAKRPSILRMQRLIGHTLDELFSRHLGETETLRAHSGPSPEASREAFFAQYQAMLAAEAAFLQAKAPLSAQALARVLDALPDVGPAQPETAAILRRYHPLAPVEARTRDASRNDPSLPTFGKATPTAPETPPAPRQAPETAPETAPEPVAASPEPEETEETAKPIVSLPFERKSAR